VEQAILEKSQHGRITPARAEGMWARWQISPNHCWASAIALSVRRIPKI
jgi:hypothetical protein